MSNNVNLQISSSVGIEGGEQKIKAEGTSVSVRERLSSPALWAAIFGLAGLVLEACGVFRKFGITSDTWNAVITSLGTVLSAFGIINNPTDRNAL